MPSLFHLGKNRGDLMKSALKDYQSEVERIDPEIRSPLKEEKKTRSMKKEKEPKYSHKCSKEEIKAKIRQREAEKGIKISYGQKHSPTEEIKPRSRSRRSSKELVKEKRSSKGSKGSKESPKAKGSSSIKDLTYAVGAPLKRSKLDIDKMWSSEETQSSSWNLTPDLLRNRPPLAVPDLPPALPCPNSRKVHTTDPPSLDHLIQSGVTKTLIPPSKTTDSQPPVMHKVTKSLTKFHSPLKNEKFCAEKWHKKLIASKRMDFVPALPPPRLPPPVPSSNESIWTFPPLTNPPSLPATNPPTSRRKVKKSPVKKVPSSNLPNATSPLSLPSPVNKLQKLPNVNSPEVPPPVPAKNPPKITSAAPASDSPTILHAVPIMYHTTVRPTLPIPPTTNTNALPKNSSQKQWPKLLSKKKIRKHPGPSDTNSSSGYGSSDQLEEHLYDNFIPLQYTRPPPLNRRNTMDFKREEGAVIETRGRSNTLPDAFPSQSDGVQLGRATAINLWGSLKKEVHSKKESRTRNYSCKIGEERVRSNILPKEQEDEVYRPCLEADYTLPEPFLGQERKDGTQLGGIVTKHLWGSLKKEVDSKKERHKITKRSSFKIGDEGVKSNTLPALGKEENGNSDNQYEGVYRPALDEAHYIEPDNSLNR